MPARTSLARVSQGILGSLFFAISWWLSGPRALTVFPFRAAPTFFLAAAAFFRAGGLGLARRMPRHFGAPQWQA